MQGRLLGALGMTSEGLEVLELLSKEGLMR